MTQAPPAQVRRRAAIGAVCLGSALAALALSRLLFPHLSINNDEAIYRLQADAIAHGRLFPPAPEPADAFRPWLAAVRDGHYVLKYTPVLASLLAVSQLLSGGRGLLLAALAAATPAVTYLLASEVFANRRYALAAAVVMAASPLVIIQSALVLPYVLTLVLIQLFAWGLIRGVRTGSQPVLATAGVALAAALLVRPYDAVLFCLPVIAAVALGAWRGGDRRVSWMHAAWVGMPVVIAGMAFLAYNAAATGHPLKPAFSLLEPADKLGFGHRRLYPTDVSQRFTWREAVSGLGRNGELLLVWVAGGPVVLAMAVVRLVRGSGRGVELTRWLTGGALAVIAGYLFFWGPYNAARWGGIRFMGPFYLTPLLIPAALLAGAQVVEVLARRRWVGVTLIAVMTAVSASTVAGAVSDNRTFDHRNEALHDLVMRHARGGLVFADLREPFLMHPTAVVSNRWDGSGPVVYAVARPEHDFSVAGAEPQRALFRLSFNELAFFELDERLAARLQPLTAARGAEVSLRVDVYPKVAAGSTAALAVTAGGKSRSYALGEVAGGQSIGEQLVVRASGDAELAGRVPSSTSTVRASEGLTVELMEMDPQRQAPRTLASVRLPVSVGGGEVRVMAPAGAGWTAGEAGRPVLDVVAHP